LHPFENIQILSAADFLKAFQWIKIGD
jgi:hypothetical protein